MASALSGELQISATSQPASSAACAASSGPPATLAPCMLRSSLKITPWKPKRSRSIDSHTGKTGRLGIHLG
jgi:hypothetical protein